MALHNLELKAYCKNYPKFAKLVANAEEGTIHCKEYIEKQPCLLAMQSLLIAIVVYETVVRMSGGMDFDYNTAYEVMDSGGDSADEVDGFLDMWEKNNWEGLLAHYSTLDETFSMAAILRGY